MRLPRVRAWWLVAMVALIAALSPGLVQADGPWKAQVIDAETGQPLQGVVVLAYWIKYHSSLGGWAGGEYYDAEEVVTDADGRFVIGARSTVTLNPFTRIAGPSFVMFKPGYGLWRFQGPAGSLWDAVERKAYVQKAWEQFTGPGVVIELPPLKTRQERLEFIRSLSWAPVVPPDQTKRLHEAMSKERAYLGLPN